jgi:hypothetical protein
MALTQSAVALRFDLVGVFFATIKKRLVTVERLAKIIQERAASLGRGETVEHPCVEEVLPTLALRKPIAHRPAAAQRVTFVNAITAERRRRL